ncbi:MAG: hypothetical protein L6U16_09020 [Porphyromonadaceae bacterium]|nr:MAG: hypothetical protein L6U16_09020 [Porphyromonadaceae bacterium]
MIDIQYDITVIDGREVSRPYHSPATLAKPNFRKTSPKSHIFVDFGEVLRNIWGNSALDSLIFSCLFNSI